MPAKVRLVLIADDYFETAETLGAAIATATGCEVITATDGRQAVDLALARRPDLALLDIDMPFVDGLEAARKIRLAAGNCRPVLVAYTGGVYADSAKRSALFDFVLTKPTDFDQLLKLIDPS